MLFRHQPKAAQEKSDEELISEFSTSGDIELLGRVYSRYMHLVYGVCLKYLRNRDESRDAVMQIFEKLITEVPRQPVGNFRGWLYVVARNYCLMQLRSAKSREEQYNEWAKDTIIMENGQEMHPIDEEGPDMEADLADCIDRLKDEQKACIRLFYFEKRCYTEIAASLRI